MIVAGRVLDLPTSTKQTSGLWIDSVPMPENATPEPTLSRLHILQFVHSGDLRTHASHGLGLLLGAAQGLRLCHNTLTNPPYHPGPTLRPLCITDQTLINSP